MEPKHKKQPEESLNIDAYRFAVRALSKDEGGGFLIEYPDFPGCISDGETPEEAIANGRDALKSTLLTLRELKGQVPRPDQCPCS
jgi:antitoxin HicB